MAARTKTTTDPLAALPIADMASKMREQWLTTLKQSQEFALSASKAFADLATSVPMPEVPSMISNMIPMPAMPALPPVGDVVTFAFDLANDTLVAQREFALQITELFKRPVGV
jgi:hypothetical protein